MKLAALTMQKNESGILRQWISYYSHLCGGAENLYIFDDHSTGEVIEVLEQAEAAGVNIQRNDGSWKLEDKGLLFDALIKKLGTQYDWYLPVDCDEFICLRSDDGPVFSVESIRYELSSIETPLARLRTSYENVPYSTFVYHWGTMKVAIKGSDTPESVGGYGLHAHDFSTGIDTSPSEYYSESNLANVHFHNRPLSLAIKMAREKLKNRIPEITPPAMRAYSGDGYHLVDLFFVTDEQYRNRFRNKNQYDIGPAFEAMNLTVPYSGKSDNETVVPFNHLPGDDEVPVLQTDPIDRPAAMAYVKGSGMTSDGMLALRTCLHDTNVYLEYGAGHSTVMACNMAISKIVSIECDLAFIENLIMQHDLKPRIDVGQVTLQHIDLGTLANMGHPVEKPAESSLQAYYNTASAAADADLVLIDGRYRVATAAALYAHAPENCRFLLPNFFQRQQYSRLLTFFDISNRLGEAAVLIRTPDRYAAAQNALEATFYDPL